VRAQCVVKLLPALLAPHHPSGGSLRRKHSTEIGARLGVGPTDARRRRRRFIVGRVLVLNNP
jgi:hypothetical protein